MWSYKSVQEAYDILEKPDLVVTNQRDKTVQLDKVLALDEAIRTAMDAQQQAVTAEVVSFQAE